MQVEPKVERLNDAPDWADVEANWRPEPELRGTLPRPVVPRAARTGCGDRALQGCISGLMVLMWLLGVTLTAWAGLALLIVPFGVPGQATVTAHKKTQGSASGQLDFRFLDNGRVYTGTWPANAALYRRLRDGATTPVRYFPFAPGLRPMLSAGASPWYFVGVLGPLGLLILVVSSLVLVAFFWPPLGKRLVRRGQAVPGVVVERFWSQGISGAEGTWVFSSAPSHGVVVAYRVGNRTLERRLTLAADATRELGLGQTLTLLVLARRPQRAYPYQFCEFRAQERTLKA